MTEWVLRLSVDTIPPHHPSIFLEAAHRTILVERGELAIEFPEGSQLIPAGTAWIGSDQIAITTTHEGARIYRWELVASSIDARFGFVSAPAAKSEAKLAQRVNLPDGLVWLMRCDRVDFPLGAVAFTHVHQGPGIRCVDRGSIRVDTDHDSHTYGLGDAWLEVGIEPVIATASSELETGFVRCLLLPALSKNRSSIRYVLPEDVTKEKHQRYKVFGERLLSAL